MSLQQFRARIWPESAFGDSVRGDSLFGQLCWAVVQRFGEVRLRKLLDGYTNGQPFLVVSDAFPSGFLPRPTLPIAFYDIDLNLDRKRLKKRRWLPVESFRKDVRRWLSECASDSEVALQLQLDRGNSANRSIWNEHVQPHNTIHRMSNSTRAGEFAPYQMPAFWPTPGLILDIYLLIDTDRITPEDVGRLLDDVGTVGYGRDASIGKGRFSVGELQGDCWPQAHQGADAWLTLAPCAPQGKPWKQELCFWQPFTRFGRHGQQAIFSGRPFKTPVLLADTGAILSPKFMSDAPLAGQGLGGSGELSRAIPGTVHQGYAPALAIHLGGDA